MTVVTQHLRQAATWLQRATVFLLLSLATLSGCSEDETDSTVVDLSRQLDTSADVADAARVPTDLDFPAKALKASAEPTIAVNGITSDHFALAYEPLATSATSLLDGARKVHPKAVAYTMISNVTVFGWHNFSSLADDAESWAPGSDSLATANNSVHEIGAADAAGTHVFFTAEVVWDANAMNLVVARGDGTEPRVIADVSILSDDCLPRAQFVDDSLIALHCPVDGAGAHELLVADVGSGVQRSLRRGLRAQPFWVDPVKKTVFVADANRTGWVVPVDGSQPSFIDNDVADGLILPGAAAVVYRTSTGALKRKTIGTAVPPVVLVAQGVGGLILRLPSAARTGEAYTGPSPKFNPAVSPDGGWIVYRGEGDPMVPLSNLYLASTVIPGMTTGLVEGGRGLVHGDVFTQDSLHVLFFDDAHEAYEAHASVSGFVGKLYSRDILKGTTRLLSSGSYYVHAGRGAQVVFGDNYKTGNGYRGTQDMWWIDLAAPDGIAQPIMPRVVADWAFDKALNRAVFGVWNDPGRGREGMYTFQLP